jgi:hypothetical protein
VSEFSDDLLVRVLRAKVLQRIIPPEVLLDSRLADAHIVDGPNNLIVPIASVELAEAL